MRRLVEYRAAARGSRKLLGPPRAVEEVGEVEGRDHADGAMGFLRDELLRMKNGQIEAVAMADDQPHAVRPRCIDHPATILERKRHRLFDQDMLAARAGEAGVRGVELMRCCDINDLDRRVGTEVLDTGVGVCAVILRKSFARLGAGIGAGHDFDARVTERRRRDGERAAQAGHT
jgi:hypothetical protein